MCRAWEPRVGWLPRVGRAAGLAKRVVVALDVRSNDAGDLVVTKGDQYDVREGGTANGGEVRRRHHHRRCRRLL